MAWPLSEAPAPNAAPDPNAALVPDVTGESGASLEHGHTRPRRPSIIAGLRSRIHSREAARSLQQPEELLSPRSRPETHSVSAIGDLPPPFSMDASRLSQEEEAIVTGHQIWSLSSGLHRPASTHIGSALAGSSLATQRAPLDHSMLRHDLLDGGATRVPGCCFSDEIEAAAGKQLPVSGGGDPVRPQSSDYHGRAAARRISFPGRPYAHGGDALNALIDSPPSTKRLSSEQSRHQGAAIQGAMAWTLTCGTPGVTPLSSLRDFSIARCTRSPQPPRPASTGLAAAELPPRVRSDSDESRHHALPRSRSVGRDLEESFDEAQQARSSIPRHSHPQILPLICLLLPHNLP